MAASTEKRDGQVSSCVSNLIQSFTNGLDIFKKLRERRRKRKQRKHTVKDDTALDAELQLSNSLRKGPRDIQRSYEDLYHKAGDRFAKGDAIAHASLAETLIKLNTGLVGIIAAFLNHDSKHNRLDLGYRSLTCLSDASRMGAVESLNQLYQRLSTSQLQIHSIGACPRCGSMKHLKCSGSTSMTDEPRDGKRKHKSSKQRLNDGPTIARVPIKKTRQTQLVILRPRNAHKGSSASNSGSSKSSSSTHSSPFASPLASPLPQYAAVDPFPAQKPTRQNAPNARRRADSFDGPRPSTWPHVKPDNSIPMQLNLPPPRAISPNNGSAKEKSAPSPVVNPVKRRMDKVTPSTYTFASDSTKLGEIPEHNWTTPWNYEEAARLNAEAAVMGCPIPEESRTKGKKGIFKFLRRGSAQQNS